MALDINNLIPNPTIPLSGGSITNPPPVPTPTPTTSPTVVGTSDAANQHLAAAKTTLDGQSTNLSNQKALVTAKTATPIQTNTGGPSTKEIADALATAPSSSLTAQQAADRAGVDVSRMIPNPNGPGFVVGPATPAGGTLPPPPTGAPPAPGGAPTPDTGAPPQTDAEKAADALAKNQANQDAAFQTFQDQMTQFENGTFPLTPDQQAQIDGLKSQYDQLRQAQQLANRNYEGGMTNLQIATGRQRYAPELALGEINNAVSSGLAKIQAIDQKASAALSQMRQGFQTSNYNLVKDAYTAFQTYSTQKATEITNAQKAISDATTAAINNAKTQAETDAILNKPVTDLNTTNQDAVAKMLNQYPDAIQNLTPDQQAKLQSGTLTLGEIATAVAKSASYRAEVLKKQRDALAAGGGTPAGTTAVTNAQGQTVNVPTSVAPYYNSSYNGTGWIDGTSLQGTAAQKTQIINTAQAAGIKVINNKNAALDLSNIGNAQYDINSMLDTFSGIAATNAVTRNLWQAGTAKLSEFLQADPTKVAAQTYNDASLDILKAISGVQGFRGNQTAIQQVRDQLPKITDTVAVVKEKVNTLRKLISNRENALLGQPQSTLSSGTTKMTGPDGKVWDVPSDKVDLFKQNGYK